MNIRKVFSFSLEKFFSVDPALLPSVTSDTIVPDAPVWMYKGLSCIRCSYAKPRLNVASSKVSLSNELYFEIDKNEDKSCVKEFELATMDENPVREQSVKEIAGNL